MKIKVSDFIIEFLVQKGVTDVFGYPGGMVTHLMDSFSKSNKIIAHINYHEQASAFCACGYAQIKGIPGVAYATSGPGATNLITGICNAYFDSIPTLFITGQVNTNEAKGNLNVRQLGFQETNIVDMVKGVTKYSTYVSDANQIKYELEKAWNIATIGRKGPVLLDIPMDVQRNYIDMEDLETYRPCKLNNYRFDFDKIQQYIKMAKKPAVIVGAGVKLSHELEIFKNILNDWKIPVVSSMIAFDCFSKDESNYFGYIGAYGDRAANFIVAKSDLLITIGTRLDIRQVGANRRLFAENANIIRVDIDEGELENGLHDEYSVVCDIDNFITSVMPKLRVGVYDNWLQTCKAISDKLRGYDDLLPNKWIHSFSKKVSNNVIITTDVGQNQVWVAQSFDIKEGQKVLFSGGHGAMGYSLPAAIGAYYAEKKPVISFNGDGGIQMNIQELQFVARENLPITIVVLNNRALGMIRHFQEMYFENNYYQTVADGGYTTPDFEKIAKAYGLEYYRIEDKDSLEKYEYVSDKMMLVEMVLNEPTYVFPKLRFGCSNQDQEPLLDRKLFDELMEM